MAVGSNHERYRPDSSSYKRARCRVNLLAVIESDCYPSVVGFVLSVYQVSSVSRRWQRRKRDKRRFPSSRSFALKVKPVITPSGRCSQPLLHCERRTDWTSSISTQKHCLTPSHSLLSTLQRLWYNFGTRRSHASAFCAQCNPSCLVRIQNHIIVPVPLKWKRMPTKGRLYRISAHCIPSLPT